MSTPQPSYTLQEMMDYLEGNLPAAEVQRMEEALAGDPMLEYAIVRYHVGRDAVFGDAMLLPADSAYSRHARCMAGAARQHQMFLGRAFLQAQGWVEAEQELVRQAVFELVLHEVGHVLGLTHNFAGSQLNAPETMFRQESLAADKPPHIPINVR